MNAPPFFFLSGISIYKLLFIFRIVVKEKKKNNLAFTGLGVLKIECIISVLYSAPTWGPSSVAE